MAAAGEGTADAGGKAKPDLLIELHKSYIAGLQSKKDTFEYAATEHLRMSAIYWGLTAMELMSGTSMMDCDRIVAWINLCKHPSVRSLDPPTTSVLATRMRTFARSERHFFGVASRWYNRHAVAASSTAREKEMVQCDETGSGREVGLVPGMPWYMCAILLSTA